MDGTTVQAFDLGVSNDSEQNITTNLSTMNDKRQLVRVTYKLKHLHQ